MQTRLFGLLAGCGILLASAAQADPAPIALALWRPIEVRIDAVLLAANLGTEGEADVLGARPCRYDALNGRPELGSIVPDAAAPAWVSLEAESEGEASIVDLAQAPGAGLNPAEAVEVTGALSRPVVAQVAQSGEPEAGPLPGPDVIDRTRRN